MLIKIGLFIANTYRELATELWLHILNSASQVPRGISWKAKFGLNCIFHITLVTIVALAHLFPFQCEIVMDVVWKGEAWWGSIPENSEQAFKASQQWHLLQQSIGWRPKLTFLKFHKCSADEPMLSLSLLSHHLHFLSARHRQLTSSLPTGKNCFLQLIEHILRDVLGSAQPDAGVICLCQNPSPSSGTETESGFTLARQAMCLQFYGPGR